MEKPKTFAEALERSGTEKEKKIFSNPEIMAHFEDDELSYKRAKVIVRCLNTDDKGKTWEPDWNNPSQPKYWMWPWIKASKANPAGSGFSRTHFGRSLASTLCGSRLAFRTAEDAVYALNTFPEELTPFFLIIKK